MAMDTAKINDIIRNIYGERYRLQQNGTVVLSRNRYGLYRETWQQRVNTRLFQHRYLFAVVGILLMIKCVAAIHYYNILIDAQQNMQASIANVDAMIQRRNDLANNLSKAVFDYSKHENQVLSSITALRSLLPKNNDKMQMMRQMLRQAQAAEIAGVNSQESLLGSLSGLVAVAEQYPELKLSDNFEKLMSAMIEVEKDLAAERIKRNELVNIYTTLISKFPENIFAAIFGFETVTYEQPTEEAKQFKVIQY